jgi:Cu+-exporting ATPase
MKKTYKIEGMTCSACSAAVERATGKLKGVVKSEVNLAAEKMTVEFDENIIDRETIFEAVAKAGYKASEDKEIRKVVIPVEGMT